MLDVPETIYVLLPFLISFYRISDIQWYLVSKTNCSSQSPASIILFMMEMWEQERISSSEKFRNKVFLYLLYIHQFLTSKFSKHNVDAF